MNGSVERFLQEMRIDPAVFDADELIDLFLAEMERGLAGRPSSLAMIPSYVGVRAAVPQHEPVIVIDAGGTNLRVCLLAFDAAGSPEISHFSKVPMPGTQGELTADAFYCALADLIEPIADQSSRVGFCFSYPAEIQPDLDACLLHWSKEVRVPELVGRHIAKGLAAELKKRGRGAKQIVILNDTVACLLAGRAEGEKLGSDHFVGFILGTGTNTAYVERNAHITKLAGLDGRESQVINVESGGFAGCVRGVLDLQLDEQSDNAGSHVFEKMISGVYLGKLALELVRAAVQRGFFSAEAAGALLDLKDLPWIDVNRFLHEPSVFAGVFLRCSDGDRQRLSALFRAMVDRAAFLTAVNISAAVVKSGAGLSRDKPICINIDGSTYYKTFGLAEKVQGYLTAMLKPRGIHFACVHVEDAPVIGAAIAGLTAF